MALDKAFDPKTHEAAVAARWSEAKAYDADPDQPGESYTIVIPPPNVTAALHLGHALNNTLQDVLIRWARMSGRNALWMPGTDHAGIATQTVVEKRILKEEGRRRTDFERTEFVARVQEWKDQYEARILGQLKAMGSSCDWRRTRFTMDETCARAVRAVFFKLFCDGLIYRGHRLVNWDPATQTVLADDEVEHENIDSSFWYFRYPLESPVEHAGETITHVTVGTTRPETMLGDTAVAMNRRDERAAALVGQRVRLPIVDRLIPIIADDHVVLPDPESDDEKARFSSGFLKVTPAHDPNDWEIGLRHELEVINVMAPDGSISAKHGFDDAVGSGAEAFLGQDRFEARTNIVAWFEEQGLLAETRPYSHEVGHSYRSHVPIEPYLSRQWYIAVKKPIDDLAAPFGEGLIEGTDVPKNSLAGLALQPLLDGSLRFTPKRYTRTYQSWLENLRDWPISRQLWWGHQIPLWRKDGRHDIDADADSGQVVTIVEDDQEVSYACLAHDREELEARLVEQGWTRDADVLDTWFSSALWPFSTLGWPEPTDELTRYYPGNVLCTAREIITLWVSRMVMMGQYCLGEIPFEDVFIHAMIQDGDGRKMSKSLGNGIDPLDIIESHGSDALRYTLCAMTTQTQDVRMPVEQIILPDGRSCNTSPKFDIGRKLCTKLWNAARFVFGKLEDTPRWDPEAVEGHLSDRWILSRLDALVESFGDAIQNFRFNELGTLLYRFLYDEFCDWYVEVAKARISSGEAAPKAVLTYVLDQYLRLLHPLSPFITEQLWSELNRIAPRRGPGHREGEPLLVQARFPSPRGTRCEESEERFLLLQELVREVRNARKANNVPPNQALDARIEAPEAELEWLRPAADVLASQARLATLELGSEERAPSADTGVVMRGAVRIQLRGLVDREAETKRLGKKLEQLKKGIRGCEGKLSNERFVSSAPAPVVERERARLSDMHSELETVEAALAALA